MSDYLLALFALGCGLIGQAMASGQAIDCLLRRRETMPGQRIWACLAIAALLLALQNAYALELALKTGLYDLRQSLLGGVAGMLSASLVYALSRRT